MTKWFGVFFLVPVFTAAAGDTAFIVNQIHLSGNKRTKDRIILREMDISPGDTIPASQLKAVLARNRNQVFNLSLFNEVIVRDSLLTGSDIDIHLAVKERWYTFPVPVFELVDRNVNVWLNEQNADLTRAKYGLRFYQENVRGRNERLKVVAQMGYTQEFELSYRVPFIDRRQRLGMKLSGAFNRNREIAIATVENKQTYFEGSDFVRERQKFSVLFSRRREIMLSQYLEISFQDIRVADTIVSLNEKYLLSGSRLSYIHAGYELENDRRDIQTYPLKGSYLNLAVNRYGFGFNQEADLTEVTGKYARYWEIAPKTYASAMVKGKVSSPGPQPYLIQEGFGYGQDFVRGFEYYVIDGQQFVLFRSTAKYKLLHFDIKNPLVKNTSTFRTIPFTFYPKIFFDMGYISDDFFDRYNLANTFLSGWGAGMDIVSWYDVAIRIEYTFNNLDENALYLHFALDI